MLEKINARSNRPAASADLYDWDELVQEDRVHRLIYTDQAIFEACLKRFRPIIMTTLAAMLGGVPLALGHGDGSELRQPLGYAIVGGLILSQALTLFTTPVAYLYFDRITERLRRRKAAVAARARPADPVVSEGALH